LAVVSWPEPTPGLVIRYSYLWASEAEKGRDDGVKDRPCAIVLVVRELGRHTRVRVLPVTHSPPTDPKTAMEIPPATKRRLGLDDSKSWIVLNEANDFSWPGPDLRPAVQGNLQTVAFGTLPPLFFLELKKRLASQRGRLVGRSK
jgi:hypothetical protein